ncbi:MAG TPA: T9SS type A sorting domain-containing protein [Ignavibacteriaceae bacterium]|nr:T9SS type A sorting domain-containing protein [Ignavibacteriaceae bacterium]
MKIIKQSVFLITSVLLLFLFSGILTAQNQIPISVISNGGERQSNANYVITGTLGQVNVNQSTTTSFKLQSGFWYLYYQDVIVNVEEEDLLPLTYKLEQNYPNPFNPSTIIKFAVPERTRVLIKVYDILGGEITSLVNEELDAGRYEKTFDASTLSTGVYIYRIQAGSYVNTKKMLLIK